MSQLLNHLSDLAKPVAKAASDKIAATPESEDPQNLIETSNYIILFTMFLLSVVWSYMALRGNRKMHITTEDANPVRTEMLKHNELRGAEEYQMYSDALQKSLNGMLFQKYQIVFISSEVTRRPAESLLLVVNTSVVSMRLDG